MANFFRILLILLVGITPLRGVAEPVLSLFDFVATDSQGKPVNFSSLRGKPLVINFWARWCAPCRKEIPDFVEMDARYRSKGITIVGMALEETQYREAVRDFVKAYAVEYPILLTGTSKGVDLMMALGNDKSALPFTVIIDRNGQQVTQKLGAMSKAEMAVAIETALK